MAYQFYLNHNYGKVEVQELPVNKTYVAVVQANETFSHIQWCGLISYSDAQLTLKESPAHGYYSFFFGSPMYRLNGDFSWKSLPDNYVFICFVLGEKVYGVKVNGEPMLIPLSSIEEGVLGLKIIKTKKTKNNVISIFKR